MRQSVVGLAVAVIYLVPVVVSGNFLPRGLNGLVRAAQGIFRPAGSRARNAATMLALMRASTTTTTTTVAPIPARLDSAGSSINAQDMTQYLGMPKSSSFDPSDLLGQLAISFDKQNAEGQHTSSSDDVVAQVSGMLPMLLSIAKPVMGSYKGTDGYEGLMNFLQDAKQLLSNRSVVRQLNQFLDDLIVGDATGLPSQTPPTPSDSSLNSLAQIAQNMESLFNVPQSHPKRTRGRGKSTTADSANEVVTVDDASDPNQ